MLRIDQLSDCPACGSRPAWHVTETGEYSVHCTNGDCPLSGDYAATSSLYAAMIAWNLLAGKRIAEA